MMHRIHMQFMENRGETEGTSCCDDLLKCSPSVLKTLVCVCVNDRRHESP